MSDREDIITRLETLAKLEDGWYEGGGERISAEVLTQAQNVLVGLLKWSAPIPFIYPTTEGGISAEWDAPGFWEVSLEFTQQAIEGIAINHDTGEQQTITAFTDGEFSIKTLREFLRRFKL